MFQFDKANLIGRIKHQCHMALRQAMIKLDQFIYDCIGTAVLSAEAALIKRVYLGDCQETAGTAYLFENATAIAVGA